MPCCALNIGGSEWVIIVFVALVLILGTGRLPDAAKKLGRAAAEYKRARDGIREEMGGTGGVARGVAGPVGTEREKLEAMARSMGVDAEGKTDEELRNIIDGRIGRRRDAGA